MAMENPGRARPMESYRPYADMGDGDCLGTDTLVAYLEGGASASASRFALAAHAAPTSTAGVLPAQRPAAGVLTARPVGSTAHAARRTLPHPPRVERLLFGQSNRGAGGAP